MGNLTVGVITYQRPRKLARLFESLTDVSQPDPWTWAHTVVVDNDPAGSAKPVVDEWLDRLPGLTYVAEQNTGLSVARNRAVDASSEAGSAWLAFIDDDEEASPQWLAELAGTQIATSADAVVGNTTFAFEASPPAWLADSGVYDFTPDSVDQADTEYVSTNNLLLRTALVEDLGPLFDDRFSKTGGEDHHLGHRLVRGDFKLVQSTGGMTTEWVPSDRMQLGTVVKRLQRDGNTLAIVDLAFATSDTERNKIRLHHLLEGLAKLPLGAARAVLYAGKQGQSGVLRGLKTSLIGIGQIRAAAGQDVLGYHVAAGNIAANKAHDHPS